MTAVEVREQFVEFSGDYLDRITLKSKNLAEKIDLEHITDYNKEFFYIRNAYFYIKFVWN